MYEFLLISHNFLRWLVLILALLAVITAFIGWFGKREWSETDRKIGTFYTIGMDIQLLLGLLLYFFYSPYGLDAIRNLGFSGLMSSDVPRDFSFFGMEHIFIMVVAVVFAHLGSILARKAADSNGKFKRAAIFFSLSLLTLVVGIPWWRPLIHL
jgi:hypothetical protein